MVTRKILHSATNITGTAPDDQEFESALEQDFFFSLRFDRTIKSWGRPQKPILWIDHRQRPYRTRKYTPDVEVHYLPDADGVIPPSALFEVKPDFDPARERPKDRMPRKRDPVEDEIKWKAADLHCRQKGWTFHVVREADIRTPLLRNAKFLMRFLERDGADYGRQQLLDSLDRNGSQSITQLLESVEPDAAQRYQLRPALWRLIAKRSVAIDLSVRLADSAIVSLP